MNNLLPQWHSHMSFRKVNMQLSREIYLQPSARKTTLHTRFQSCFLDYILANATKIIRQTISSFLYPHKGMFTVTSIPPSGGGCIFGRHRLVSFLRWPNLSHDSWAVDSVLARWLWKNRAHYQDCTRPRLASQLTQFLWLCSRIRCELATTQRLCVAKSTVKMCCASPCRLAELLSNWPWNHGLLD